MSAPGDRGRGGDGAGAGPAGKGEVEALWARLRTDPAFSSDDDRRLAGAAADDPALLRELVEDDCVHGMLATIGRSQRDPEPFGARVLRRLQLETEAPRFASRVTDRLRGRPAAPAGGAGRRSWLAWAAPITAAALAAAGIALWLSGEGPPRDAARSGSHVAAHAGRQATPAPRAPAPAPGAAATVVSSRGDATLTRGATALEARPGLAVAAGERLRTAAGAGVQLRLLGGSRLDLGAQSDLVLEPPDGAAGARATARLETGSLEARVVPRPAGPAIVLATPHARATVVGTRLALHVRPDETSLEVAEGRVLFQRLADGGVVEVGPGGRARAGRALEAARRADPAPEPLAPATAPSANIVLYDFDFEDGVLLRGKTRSFTQGHVVEGPRGSRSRYALIGTLRPSWPREHTVTLEGYDPPLITYVDSLVLSFDYWLGPGSPRLYVQLYSTTKRQNYAVRFSDPATGRWARAVVRLRDLKGLLDARRPLEDGDTFHNITILGGRPGGPPLYIDNLRLEDVAPDVFPATNSARAQAFEEVSP
jgi:hypothetical protein